MKTSVKIKSERKKRADYRHIQTNTVPSAIKKWKRQRRSPENTPHAHE